MKALGSIAVALFSLVPVTSAQRPGFWERRKSLATPRQEVAAAVIGTNLYVSGGLIAGFQSTRTVEVYNTRTRVWRRIPDMPQRLHHHGMCALQGKLWVIGGYTGRTFSPTAQCHMYDPSKKLWSRIADLPQARGALVAVAIGGRIYAVGGVERFAGVVARLTVYDPGTNSWKTLPSMPTAREHLAATELGGKLFVAGGRRSGRLFQAVESFDPAKRSWTTHPPMPTARGGTGAAALDGRLIVLGGEARRNFPEAEEYDPVTRRWRRLRDMLVPLHGIYPVTVGDEIIVAGGGLVPGLRPSTTVIALRRNPTGVVAFGASTPACRGTILANVSELPIAGAAGFRVDSSPNAPIRSFGVLVVGFARDVGGTPFLGARLHVALRPAPILFPVSSDAAGMARAPLPLPSNARNAVFVAQLLLASPRCPRGPLSATNALAVPIR